MPLDNRQLDRVSRAAAATLAVVGLLTCAATVALAAWVRHRTPVQPVFPADLVLGSLWPVAGALVVRSRPRSPAGWMLMLPAAIGPYLLLSYYAAASLVVDPTWPGTTFATWVGTWGFCAYFFAVPLLPLTFPDGPGPSPRWRYVVVGVLGVASVTTLARMLAPVELDVSPRLVNPWSLPGGDWLNPVVLVGSFLCIAVGSVLGAVSLVLRMRAARGRQRAQLQWLMLGGLVLACGLLAALALDRAGAPGHADEVLMSVALAAPPVCIVVAMARHRLFDVELVLNRGLVLVGVSALVVAVYLATVLAVGSVVPADSALGLLLVAGAALLAASARGWVQAGVDRLLFGLRRDPYAVVSHVGAHVAAASEPVEALQRLVVALRSALRLPYVAFDGAVSVAAGEPGPAGHHEVPASALGRDVGRLYVGRRSPGERLTDDEQEAVADVAARAAALAYAAALVSDVAASRERIVLAREEERRRLRADLHDGVGPVLAGTAHQLDALARRLDRGGDPDSAARARDLRDRLRATVGDVRAVVHGLRPPVLDQLGLERALLELVAGYETPACAVLVPAPLGALPAAVEVAAYQITAEAVTNAVRHSAAARVRVTAARTGDGGPGRLLLEVCDDGRGMPSSPTHGVGLHSMGERAAEVGGRLDLLPTPGGGTTVRAVLPLGSEEVR